MPMRGCTNRTEPAMTLMFQVTASPAPGPFTVSCVLPTARPVSVPVCGSKLAIAGSATLQRTGPRFAYHKVWLLHDDRRRRGEPARGRRLDRPLTRRERHDVTALIDARDVRSQRRPVDDHRRRRGAILFQRARRYP